MATFPSAEDAGDRPPGVSPFSSVAHPLSENLRLTPPNPVEDFQIACRVRDVADRAKNNYPLSEGDRMILAAINEAIGMAKDV